MNVLAIRIEPNFGNASGSSVLLPSAVANCATTPTPSEGCLSAGVYSHNLKEVVAASDSPTGVSLRKTMTVGVESCGIRSPFVNLGGEFRGQFSCRTLGSAVWHFRLQYLPPVTHLLSASQPT